jgi:hypothetical protein
MKKTKQNARPEVRGVEYNGMMSEYQLTGNTLNGEKVGLVIHTSMNNYQNFLYNRAMFGLSVYTQEEINSMHWEKRKRIVKVQKKTRMVLNVWKQQLANMISAAFFKKLFPKTDMAAYLIETVNEIDPELNGTLDFKMLGITKKQIVGRLIMEGVLPANFYELKPETPCK